MMNLSFLIIRLVRISWNCWVLTSFSLPFLISDTLVLQQRWEYENFAYSNCCWSSSDSSSSSPTIKSSTYILVSFISFIVLWGSIYFIEIQYIEVIPISYHNPPKFNHTESTILQLQCLLHLHSKFPFRITIHPNSTTLNPQSCSCSACCICIPNSHFVSQSTQIQPHWIHNLAVAVPAAFAFQIPISYHNPPKFNHTESTILQLQCLLHLHSKFPFRITIHPNSTTLNPQSCSCSACCICIPNSHFVSQSTQIQPHWIHNLAVAVPAAFAFQIPISYHNPPKFNHTESTILQLQCLLHLHSKFPFRITIHPNSTTLNPQSCSCSACCICIPNSHFVSQSTQIQPHWIHNLAVAVPPAFAFQIPISYHNPPKFNHTESTILQLQCLLHLHSKFPFRITIHPNSTTLNPQSCSCSACCICIPNSHFVSQSTQIQPHWIHNLAVAVPAAFAFQIPISYHNPPKFNHTESTILQLQCLLHLHSKFPFRITIHPNSTTLNPQSCSCSACCICIPNSHFVSQSTQIQPHWIHNLAVAVPAAFAFQIPISYHNPPKFNHTESTILQLQCLLHLHSKFPFRITIHPNSTTLNPQSCSCSACCICIPNSHFVSQSTQIQPHWIHNLAVAVPAAFAFQIPISYHNPPKFNHTESTILQLQCLLHLHSKFPFRITIHPNSTTLNPQSCSCSACCICIPNSHFVSQSTQIQPHWIHNLAVAVPAAFAFQIPISYHNPPKFNHTESTILQLQCLLHLHSKFPFRITIHPNSTTLNPQSCSCSACCICIPNSHFVSQSTQIQPHWIHNLAVAVPAAFAFQIPISYHNPPKFNHTESTILQLQCLLHLHSKFPFRITIHPNSTTLNPQSCSCSACCICIPNSHFVSQSTQIQPHWIHNLAVAVPACICIPNSHFVSQSTQIQPHWIHNLAVAVPAAFAFQIPISYHNPPKFNHTESTILQLQCLLHLHSKFPFRITIHPNSTTLNPQSCSCSACCICIPNSHFVSQSTQIQPHWIHNLAVAVPAAFAFQIPISYHNPPKFNHTESTILQLQCLLHLHSKFPFRITIHPNSTTLNPQSCSCSACCICIPNSHFVSQSTQIQPHWIHNLAVAVPAAFAFQIPISYHNPPKFNHTESTILQLQCLLHLHSKFPFRITIHPNSTTLNPQSCSCSACCICIPNSHFVSQSTQIQPHWIHNLAVAVPAAFAFQIPISYHNPPKFNHTESTILQLQCLLHLHSKFPFRITIHPNSTTLNPQSCSCSACCICIPNSHFVSQSTQIQPHWIHNLAVAVPAAFAFQIPISYHNPPKFNHTESTILQLQCLLHLHSKFPFRITIHPNSTTLNPQSCSCSACCICIPNSHFVSQSTQIQPHWIHNLAVAVPAAFAFQIPISYHNPPKFNHTESTILQLQCLLHLHSKFPFRITIHPNSTTLNPQSCSCSACCICIPNSHFVSQSTQIQPHCIYANGDYYIGEFKVGYRNGEGTYYIKVGIE